MGISEALSIAFTKGARTIPCPFSQATNHPGDCACMGTGKVQVCENCQGSGWDGNKNQACKNCRGRGALPKVG